jgi:SAM-dependent MidA family methyltransferase
MIEVRSIKKASCPNPTYRVKESLKLWNFIPMKPDYEVEVIISQPEKHIQYTSEVSKGIFLTIDYTFIEDTKKNTAKVLRLLKP